MAYSRGRDKSEEGAPVSSSTPPFSTADPVPLVKTNHAALHRQKGWKCRTQSSCLPSIALYLGSKE